MTLNPITNISKNDLHFYSILQIFTNRFDTFRNNKNYLLFYKLSKTTN